MQLIALFSVVVLGYLGFSLADSVRVKEPGNDVMCSDKDFSFSYPDITLTDSFNKNLDVCERIFEVADDVYNLCCTKADRSDMIMGCEPFEEEYSEEGTYPYLCSDDTDASCDGVDTSSTGTYLLAYTAMDLSENIAAEEKVTVIMEDTDAPVIVLESEESYLFDVEKCDDWSDLTVTSEDCVDGYIEPDVSIVYLSLSSSSHVVEGTNLDTESLKTEIYCTSGESVDEVDTETPGYYCVSYTAEDESGNVATTETVVVLVEDTTTPEVEFVTSSFTEECAALEALPESEAYALDTPCPDSLSATLTWDTAAVVDALETVGTHYVQYEATDGYNIGYNSFEMVIEDTTDPTITCPNDVEIEVESDFTFLWAEYSDECDDDVTIVQSGYDDVDADEVGEYTITFTATDASGNTASCSQEVIVEDTTDPLLTLTGEEYYYVEACTGTYTEDGATVTDNYDDDVSITVTYSDTIDVDVVGDYTVTYAACDDYDNCATDLIRYVYVEDTVAPVVHIEGGSLVMKEAGEYQKNSGASATDTCNPTEMTPCVACSDDEDECLDHCVSFTSEVIEFSEFTHSEIESEYWEAVYGDAADSLVYYCGESYDYAENVREEAESAQNLTYFGESCGEYLVTYYATDANGNVGHTTQYIWTVDTTDPTLTVSLSTSMMSFNQLVGLTVLIVASLAVVAVVIKKKVIRSDYEPIPL